MHDQWIVVTNCTTRKRAHGPAARPEAADTALTLEHFADAWSARVAALPATERADAVYQGRAMVEARRAATALGASLFIVSAGLGLLAGTDRVPHYDLSAGDGQGLLADAVRRSGKPLTAWWELVTARAPAGRRIASLLAASPQAILLLALPASYLRLIRDDLGRVTEKDRARLRVLTSEAGVREIPDHLRGSVMPYDERLESIAGYAGTRSDFPQRALRHFVVQLNAGSLPESVARQAVMAALSPHAQPSLPPRRRVTDAEAMALIRQGWDRCNGHSTRLHRYLRDDLQVACEQGRFRDLWYRVNETLSGNPS